MRTLPCLPRPPRFSHRGPWASPRSATPTFQLLLHSPQFLQDGADFLGAGEGGRWSRELDRRGAASPWGSGRRAGVGVPAWASAPTPPLQPELRACPVLHGLACQPHLVGRLQDGHLVLGVDPGFQVLPRTPRVLEEDPARGWGSRERMVTWVLSTWADQPSCFPGETEAQSRTWADWYQSPFLPSPGQGREGVGWGVVLGALAPPGSGFQEPWTCAFRIRALGRPRPTQSRLTGSVPVCLRGVHWAPAQPAPAPNP